ncbi:MAG TPA: glycosyltransferase, partial [Thermoanaerobaculia bacterium]|nr:glycosyltransferase [Thermoanaerobaculia bacterium]
KVLLDIGGRSLLQANVELLRDSLGVYEITVLVGYRADLVRSALGNGSRLGVALDYLEVSDVEAGLARGILEARNLFSEPFITLLGDELYLRSNHSDLADYRGQDFDAVCAVLATDDENRIRANYSVRLDGERIVGLEEKPERNLGHLLGTGTYLFSPRIFEAIEQTPRSARSGRVELTDALGRLAAESGRVYAFPLEGTYWNVNSADDHDYAQYLARSERFRDARVSVVIPAYNEALSIGSVVREFLPHVDEVLVVDNHSSDATAEVARRAGARVETVALEGYGDTLRHGLARASGDILVMTEADHSFRAKDLGKLLEYLKDADLVVGSRTTRELNEHGTNMHGVVRWANVLVAKLIEVLWWSREPRFTDVGCTYRALWRSTYNEIAPLLAGKGPELSPEMMICGLLAGRRVIEIPVSYHRRLGGESKHSASFRALARTALKMLRTIFRLRLRGAPVENGRRWRAGEALAEPSSSRSR